MPETIKDGILVALKRAFLGPSFRKEDLSSHPKICEAMADAGISLDDLVGERTELVSGSRTMPVMLNKNSDDSYSFMLWRSSMPRDHNEWVRLHSRS